MGPILIADFIQHTNNVLKFTDQLLNVIVKNYAFNMFLQTIETAVSYPVSFITIVYKRRIGDRVSSSILMQMFSAFDR